MREGMFYEKLPGGKVLCHLCPHGCRFGQGGCGKCRIRVNREGILIASNYGVCSALALDPIEKKPLYHFFPGSTILSAGTVGCNFHCEFCQNWEIAHGSPSVLRTITPEALVDAARAQAGEDQQMVGIAYTYSEPLMWYEFVLDTARLARQEGLKNVLVTNGFIQPAPLKKLLPYIDAMNIDVKGFTGGFYRRVIHGAYEPVLATAESAHRAGCHVEITTLLIPGLNDTDGELHKLAGWLAGVSPDIPLHLSRYFPNYKLDLDPTPLETLIRARTIAGQKLKYVYLGNAGEIGGCDTHCPQCGEILIQRRGYSIRISGLTGGRCAKCGGGVPVIGPK